MLPQKRAKVQKRNSRGRVTPRANALLLLKKSYAGIKSSTLSLSAATSAKSHDER